MQRDARHGSDDAELIRAAGADPSAFGALYDRHALSVHAWCTRRLQWAASDLTAETFAQAWLSRSRFRDDHSGSALPWLIGIARNVLRETIRADRVETRARERLGLPVDLASDDGYASVEARLSPRVALAAALEELPEHEREALELRVLEELPYEEVAEQLSIRPAAARLRVSRALRRLALTTTREDRP
jgi:RNA polymerase sigma-70 factor (ECF subfamily)